MIVIHVDTTPDAAKLSYCYDGLADITVLRNPNRRQVLNILRDHPAETVMMLGHGSAQGLWSADHKSYIVDSRTVYLLRDRTVIGIWCYAAEFGDKYGLHGFFTSMFISNLAEACMNSFYNTDEQEINHEFDLFCSRIHHLLVSNTQLSEWVQYLQDRANIAISFVRFNYEALCYFE